MNKNGSTNIDTTLTSCMELWLRSHQAKLWSQIFLQNPIIFVWRLFLVVSKTTLEETNI